MLDTPPIIEAMILAGAMLALLFVIAIRRRKTPRSSIDVTGYNVTVNGLKPDYDFPTTRFDIERLNEYLREMPTITFDFDLRPIDKATWDNLMGIVDREEVTL